MATLLELKDAVCAANLDLARLGLALFTWGNVSAVDREGGLVVIKPSGVPYDRMKPADMSVVSLSDGKLVEGALKPSSDTPTHIALYQAFPGIGGIAHTHSPAATAWAQACRSIPCLGTTHADHFYGAIPCTAVMNDVEIAKAYERQTGEVIVRRFAEANLDPVRIPAVLVANHGPFTWGPNGAAAVVAARVLEECASMALHTFMLRPDQPPISQRLLDKHFLRKHGPGAYYGQAAK